MGELLALRQLAFGAMGEVKHLCLVKFREGVEVDDVLKGMADLVAGMDMVKSFEWYSFIS